MKLFELKDSNNLSIGIISAFDKNIKTEIKKLCEKLSGERVLYVADLGYTFEVGYPKYGVYLTAKELN